MHTLLSEHLRSETGRDFLHQIEFVVCWRILILKIIIPLEVHKDHNIVILILLQNA